jgi:hypothetical protein
MIDPDDMVGGGLQPERTELAWLRTGFGASGLVLLAAHLGATEHGIPWPVVVTVISVALACGAGATVARVRSLQRRPPVPSSPGALALLCASVVIADALTLVVILAG